jgi:replicative DNA helicase
MNALIDMLPPCSIDAEEAVLGSMIAFQDSIVDIRAAISADDFFIVKHRMIYEAITSLYMLRQGVDYVTIVKELEKRQNLEEIGGPAFISRLLNSTPNFVHGPYYANIVAETAKRRRLIEAASSIAQLAYNQQGDIDEQISQSRAMLSDVDGQETEARSITQVAGGVFDQLVEWHETPLKPGEVRGTTCGLKSIDLMIGGFEPRKLYVMAARPAMGKSSLAFQMGFDMARRTSKRVLMFSIEMSADEVVQRWISRLIRVPFDDLKRGNIGPEKWQEIVKAYSHISELAIIINDSSRMTIGKMEADISRYTDLGLVIVDHLGLMSDALMKGENETHRIGRVTWAFKQFAKIYDVPVLAISQLNRGVEARRDKRPLLSDLRESGDIEQNADVVLMLYRDDYYNESSKTKGICEVIPRKVRSGDSNAMAKLYFNRSITEFGEISHDNA